MKIAHCPNDGHILRRRKPDYPVTGQLWEWYCPICPYIRPYEHGDDM
ncbi:hypothetical protein IT072_13610 [Leifsonia sp. ZF2019]|nr:hypothetical protein [Leifsonia sp. ZF2019]UAJ78295.1 hypothetical protein IT072_13610 [Leifsonia sp. ZF2019]